MEMEIRGKNITFSREENSLDRFVFSFCSILEKCFVEHVIVSGYVAIVFGRSRHTEDVDILFLDCGKEGFARLFLELGKEGFECLNEKDAATAYLDYIKKGSALRFAAVGTFIPNIEFKLSKSLADRESLRGKNMLLLNGKKLFISPFELQIAYKLFLGSDKDIEDAVYLYELFKEHVLLGKIREYASDLKVKDALLSRLVGT